MLDQIAAIVEAQRDAFAEALDTTLATKPNLERIERKLLEHDGKFSVAEAKMDKLAWAISVLSAIAVADFVKQFF
jgi:predicted RNase H-like nuclease (RuvC/YqgF family)